MPDLRRCLATEQAAPRPPSGDAGDPPLASVQAHHAGPVSGPHFAPARPVDVSVCIANWNCRDILRGCLASLSSQPPSLQVEVIVVDNGSRDGAPEMVAREFPRVQLVRNATNHGFARANNQAASLAHGRYLLFLNNDTMIPPAALDQLVEYADKHPEVGMIGPKLRDGAGRPQVSYRMRPTMAMLLHRTSLLRWTGLFRGSYRRYRRQDFDPNATRPVEVLMGAALLLPRNVFFDCGGWDEEFLFGGEDLALSFQVGRRYPVMYHPQVEIVHYGRMSTRQHIGYASTQMTAGFARYLRKAGCSERALWAYKVVVLLDGPLQLMAKGLQYMLRRFQGRREAAEKSLISFWGSWHFVTRGFRTFLRV